MLKALLLVSVIGWSAEALACDCGAPPPVFFPKEGSVGVPTNVQFLFGHVDGTITLFGPGRVVVDSFTSNTVHRMSPRMPLAPDTDYVLIPGGPAFRTGAGPDTTPPTLTDFEFTSYGSPPIDTLQSSCGTSEWIAFQPTASDDSTPEDQLHYDFFFGSTESTVDLTTPRLTLERRMISEGGCAPSNFPMRDTARIAGALTAIDWAGNRSAPSPVHLLKSCGCASGADALPFAALGLMLLAARRRSSS